MDTDETKSGTKETTAQVSGQSSTRELGQKAQGSTTLPEEPSYRASIHPGESSYIPTGLAKEVLRLEQAFSKLSRKKGMSTEIWLLIQAENKEDKDRAGTYVNLNENVRKAFFSARDELSEKKQVVLLIDSVGGSAKSAYQLATFLRHYCGRFVALVPRSAKSAATLLTLGAHEIILGNYGELGPVDAQVREGDEYIPALDRVKTLERLHASALEALDRTMALLTLRTRTDIDRLLPRALEFAASLSQPYIKEQDMVDYTRMSRVLKIGEDYASRLLERHFESKEVSMARSHSSSREGGGTDPHIAGRTVEEIPYEVDLSGDYSHPSKRKARMIAQHLSGAYPDHGFAIDEEEARSIGLQVVKPPKDIEPMVDALVEELNRALADRRQGGLTLIGRVVEA